MSHHGRGFHASRAARFRFVAGRGALGAVLTFAALASAPSGVAHGADPVDDGIHQVAPSAAFAASLYEGPTTIGELLRFGDFGLGATSPLEGEMIVLDGTAYHASPHGEVTALPPSARTPFAFVKHFRADRTIELPPFASLDELSRVLDATIPTPNVLYAARITGRLEFLKLRSVARQEKPYKPLADVIRAQNVFEAKDVDGTLVGFRFPSYLSGVNTSGWHFHFVDAARRLGGHVLDVRAGALPATLDESRSLTLVLPEDAAFDATDFTRSGDGGEAFRAAVHPDAAGDGKKSAAEGAPAADAR